MKKTHERLTGLLTLLVFAVFALCVLRVLLTGAGVYQRLAERTERGYEGRVAVQYIATRVRQAQSVEIEDFGGCQALALGETIEDEQFLTRVYLYEGYVYELFSHISSELEPMDGEKILPAEILEFSLENGLLTANVDGKVLNLHIRTGKVVGP